MAEAGGVVGAHAGNASPDANVAIDGAGLDLAPGLGELAAADGVEAEAVAAPGSVGEEGAGVVHADSARRTTTSVAAAGLCKGSLPDSPAKVEPEWTRQARACAAAVTRPSWSAARR